MRILHLLASPFWSGPAETVAGLAGAQRELGHQVSVAIDRKRTSTAAEELAEPRLRALGLLDDRGLTLSVKSTPLEMLRDVRRLHASEEDVLHAHMSHDHFLLRLARPRATRIRSLHAARSLRWSLPAADGFTVAAPAWVSRLSGHPSLVLPPLVPAHFHPPPDRQRLRASLGISGDPLIGMVSTFQPSRRHALGLEAFEQLTKQRPDARLVLVGDGALAEELKRRAAPLGDRVHFAGYQQGDSFLAWLQALDEVWILGLGNDFAGRAAAQARACRVRVIAIDEGNLAHWADAVARDASPRAVVEASLGGARRTVAIPPPADVAADVLALYQRVRR